MNKPTVPEVIPLIKQYYAIEGNGNGGSLHIILEDANTHDCDVQWCGEYAVEQGDWFGARLAALLGQMSRTQRKKLAAQSFYPWWESPSPFHPTAQH